MWLRRAQTWQQIEEEIKTMPNYFADYDTTVHFISEEEFAERPQHHPSRRLCDQQRTEPDGTRENAHVIEYSLKLGFQPGVHLQCAGGLRESRCIACYAEGQTGCKTAFSISHRLICLPRQERSFALPCCKRLRD